MINKSTLLKVIDISIGALLCQIFGILAFFKKDKYPILNINPENIHRALIIRPGGIGDMILLLPIIKAFSAKFPDASLDIVCEKRNVEVLKLGGLEENALVYDSNPIRFLWHLWREKYDISIDTEQFHHFSAIFGTISNAPVKIGFKINPRRNTLYTHLINYAPDGFEGKQFMKLLEPIGIKDSTYRLDNLLSASVFPPISLKDNDKQLHKINSFVIIHPGSSTVYKLWEPDNFAKLTSLLYSKYGLDTVFIGGKKDVNLINNILIQIKEKKHAVSYSGKLTLIETASIMKHAKLFIGTDSGIAHMAIALGISTVVIFGPTDHLKWGVEDNKHAIARKNFPCSPCFIFGYHKPCRVISCMKQITVDDVFTECQKVIQNSSPASKHH